MLRTACPNISIITNFGCRANCWYCIWKGHELQDVNEPTNWEKLERFLSDNRDKGKVSVSGGGDCLYKFDEHADWWDRLFELTDKFNMLVDMHTREKLTRYEFWRERINRCVFSSDRLRDDMPYLEYLSKLVKIRITHLVTADTTFDQINAYLSFQRQVGCQFTIKELVGHDDNGMYIRIRERYPDIFYVDAGDYNTYYMPDNSIRHSFMREIKAEAAERGTSKLTKDGQFMSRGINATAAALTFRKLASFGVEMRIRLEGSGTNCVLHVYLTDGRYYELKTARQCFDLYDILQSVITKREDTREGQAHGIPGREGDRERTTAQKGRQGAAGGAESPAIVSCCCRTGKNEGSAGPESTR